MNRLSQLQKKIIVVLFRTTPNDFYEDVESANKKDLIAVKKLTDDGYIFTNDFCIYPTNKPSGQGRYVKKIPKHQLCRLRLLIEVFHWQNYSKYKYPWAGFRRWNIPPDYNKKNASLSRCLRLLSKKEIVDLLHQHEMVIEKLPSKKEFEEQKVERLQKLKNEYEEYKVHQGEQKSKNNIPDNPFAVKSFDDYLDTKKINLLGQRVTARGIFKSDFAHRYAGITKYVRLTPKGIHIGKSLLNVNVSMPTKSLTIRNESL